MKFFYDVFSVVAVAVGSVIGAGFITGRELVSFFGVGNFLPYLILSCIILFGLFFMLFKLGNKHKSLDALNSSLMKRPMIFKWSILFACFISVSGLYAGMDNLFFSLTGITFPVLSIILLIVVSITSKFGIKGVEKASVIFIPLLIIVVNFLIFKSSDIVILGGEESPFKGIIGAILFAMLNVFINLPALVDSVANKNKKTLVFSAFFSAIILLVQSVFILGAIKGSNSTNYQMPLFGAVKGSGVILFSFVLLIAMISSMISAYYPLYNFAREKGKGYGIVFLAIFIFCFSRLGLKNIVDYAYPIIGILGIIYVFRCLSSKKKV